MPRYEIGFQADSPAIADVVVQTVARLLKMPSVILPPPEFGPEGTYTLLVDTGAVGIAEVLTAVGSVPGVGSGTISVSDANAANAAIHLGGRVTLGGNARLELKGDVRIEVTNDVGPNRVLKAEGAEIRVEGGAVSFEHRPAKVDRLVIEASIDETADPGRAGEAIARIVRALSALQIALGGRGLVVESGEALQPEPDPAEVGV